MKRYVVTLGFVAVLAGMASAEESARQLTMKEAIKLAVETNLDVRAELYNPASAEADIHKYTPRRRTLLRPGVRRLSGKGPRHTMPESASSYRLAEQ